jgi:hypothetical protein
MLAASCALSVFLTWSFMTSTGQANRLEQELLTAHFRSLLHDSPIQVASSDAHNVKPWFAGRVDFAPDVKDLTVEGFPLLGGRLDYVGERRVGALVYRRRLHIVNVFMWTCAEPRRCSAEAQDKEWLQPACLEQGWRRLLGHLRSRCPRTGAPAKLIIKLILVWRCTGC